MSQPRITQISPDSAEPGDRAFTLTVSGENFDPGSTLLWDKAPLNIRRQPPTDIRATVPAGHVATPRDVSITVRNPDNSVSAPFTFPVAAAALVHGRKLIEYASTRL